VHSLADLRMRRLCIFEPVAQTAWRRRCWAAKLRSWRVPQNFLLPPRDQPLLMPVDMREWLREDDLVFVVLDAVATLVNRTLPQIEKL
jgi:hypothetical protein